ncbi:MAG: PAS domain-containing protein [Caulobacteraceae bacterium]|nr:PAS domain-containing protein [Caulobacteraceae bacterium]
MSRRARRHEQGSSTAKPAPAAKLLVGAAGVWEWDVPHGLLYADSRFAELYGLDRVQAAKGLPTNVFFEAIHPDDRMRIRIAVAGVMHGADIFAKEFRVSNGDSGLRWVSAQGRADRGPDYRALRFSGVLTDITEQKRIEERLRIAQSAGGVGTFEYVSGFGTVEVSEQFCRLLGLTPTDAVALRAVNATLPEGSPPLIGDSDPEGDLAYQEFKIVRPDTGETRWVARRGELRRDAPGGGLRYIGVVHDITAFKTAEGRLRELTANLEQRVAERTKERDRVWNNSRDLLAILGEDGVLRSVSPSWTRSMGHEAEEMIGRSCRDFIAPEDHAATVEALKTVAGGQDLNNFENRWRRRDGELRWIAWQTSFDDGVIYAYGRDVTEDKARAEALREVEEQLRQSQKMEAVGQLTGGIAHDFNNMLTGILGSLDIVRRRIAEGRLEEVGRFMDAAAASAQRAAGLTHRLLAFSRRQSLDPQPLDVGGLVRSVEELLTRTLGEQISLQIRLDPEIWPAVSDSNQLENALLNLAINGRDAMPRGGLLTIVASNVSLDAAYVARHPDAATGDYVVISVTDTGEGMSADVAAKAFDPFFTTKPIGQGTGLGLSMIYGFMRQIGGYASLDSELGRGTSVRMYLPRAAAPAAHAFEGPAIPTASEEPGAGETVLVVEDESSVRMLIVSVLEELGYRPLEAANGDEALIHLRAARPIDLLVTDVGLPGLNGRQLAEMAREARPQLKVLFVTGYARNAVVRAEFLEPGMEMISKPFAINDLAAKIRQMIER